jgi:hypothetical protein
VHEDFLLGNKILNRLFLLLSETALTAAHLRLWNFFLLGCLSLRLTDNFSHKVQGNSAVSLPRLIGLLRAKVLELLNLRTSVLSQVEVLEDAVGLRRDHVAGWLGDFSTPALLLQGEHSVGSFAAEHCALHEGRVPLVAHKVG